MGYTAAGGPKGLGVFNNTPQTTADFNKARDLVALMGNYRGDMSEGERDAIAGTALYAGLVVYNTTSGKMERYTGTGWRPVDQGTETAITTFGANWVATPSYEPVVFEAGGMVHLLGAARIAQGGSLDNILTVPAGLRPGRQFFLGHFRTTTGSAAGQLHIDSSGVVSAPANYRTGSMSAGHSIPLTGSWLRG